MSTLGRLCGRRDNGGSGPWSLADFTHASGDWLQRLRSDARVETDTAIASVKWTLPDGFHSTQFLGNDHARYLQAPQEHAGTRRNAVLRQR